MLQAPALRAQFVLLPGPEPSRIQLAHLEAQQVLTLGAIALGARRRSSSSHATRCVA